MLVLMITVVLCIVILCMRRCHQKADNNVSYNTTELNTDVTIHPNPSYDVAKVNTVPTKPYSEDEYNYVQPNEFNQRSGLEDTIKMDTNPSYGVTTGGDRATAFSTHSDTKATTKQYDYDYVCDDRLLHHITAANTTSDDVKKDIPASVDQSHYMEVSIHFV